MQAGLPNVGFLTTETKEAKVRVECELYRGDDVMQSHSEVLPLPVKTEA